MVTQPARVLAPCVAESPKNHQPNYHGPTSALFDETSQPHESLSAEDCAPSADVPGTQCSLVAETSKQRMKCLCQLEAINFSSNLLDFDGIEPELGMQLLSLYWSRQLHAGLAVYRPAFMRDMACGGPYFSKLLLNAMYYSVSKHSSCLSIRRDITDRDSAGWSFRQRFRELLRDEFDKSKITTIQALLIMASSLFTRCDERSTSWLYAGNAFNMVTDMGLHATSSYCRKTSAEESEIHRRVFWSAYMIDKIQCLYQGRHPSLRIVDTDTALIFADDYEELERFDHVSFCDPKHSAPSYTISMFKALCELSVIMERIHSKIYAVSYLTKPFDDGISDSRSLYSDLKAWRKNLLPHLDFMASSSQNNPLPYNLSMLAVYNVLVILTHRLLLSDKGSVSSSPTQNTEALNACMTAANEITKILQVYEGLYNPSSATFALSYATYISAKVHLHVLAYPGSHTSTLDSLRICLKALDQQQHLYSASIRAMAMTKKLMTRTGVNADEHARSSLTDESLQTTRDASIPQNSQANVENLDFPNLESGLPENLGNTIGMEQVWLNATQFMAFDDLYYNDVSRTTNSATLLYHASNAQGGELSYGV
ncbi:hypothetical protein DL98DRAFT_436646 [Cadophora sp. DSE1049]|nr:hypothetical protein DL98DRAFT_436646 [Cadophora sp. DSE1049]